MAESALSAPRGETASASARTATASILSVAAELPAGRLTTAELSRRLGVSEEWIISRTGVRERCQAGADERLSDYAARAGEKALRAAGLSADDVDLVIVATLTQDELTPNAAPLVAHALGARRAGAFDVGAACTAFLSGLSLGAAQIESGRASNVLLIGADFVTRITDYEDKRTSPLFGDAAGAVVLGPGANGAGSIGPIVLGADGSHAGTIVIHHADRKVRMDGPEVYKHAIARMSEVTLEAVAAAGLTLEQIDLFVYHQANARITRALGERLELPRERVVDCIETLGNTSAATLPVALARSAQEGRLRPGARVLLSAFGGGLTWGGGVVEWGGRGDG